MQNFGRHWRTNVGVYCCLKVIWAPRSARNFKCYCLLHKITVFTSKSQLWWANGIQLESSRTLRINWPFVQLILGLIGINTFLLVIFVSSKNWIQLLIFKNPFLLPPRTKNCIRAKVKLYCVLNPPHPKFCYMPSS